LPLGVVSVAIAAVIVPRIASGVISGDDHALVTAQSRAYEIALGLALPAATGFALLANPIAGGLFERGAFGPQDTVAVAGALAAISAGLPGHVLEKTFGAVSFAHEDTQTPMVAALCGLAAAIVGGALLFPSYSHIGLAVAFAASGWVGAAVLGSILFRRRWLRLDGDARRRLPRIAIATAIMGSAVVLGAVVAHAVFPTGESSSSGRVAMLIVLVTLGLAIYAVALRVLGIATLQELLAGMRSR
jgi:putative peptidoglycan lipid II flippase